MPRFSSESVKRRSQRCIFQDEGSPLVTFIALRRESGASLRPLRIDRVGDDRQKDASRTEQDAVHPSFG